MTKLLLLILIKIRELSFVKLLIFSLFLLLLNTSLLILQVFEGLVALSGLDFKYKISKVLFCLYIIPAFLDIASVLCESM